MNPYSIESSENLAFRATLGGELYTSSISTHPKITGSWATTSSFASNSNFYTGSGIFINNYEYFFLNQFPAGIRNRVSNKVRQENNVLPYSASTDPLLNNWYNSNGYENADMCAWTFGQTTLLPNNSYSNVTLGANNTKFLLQRALGSNSYCYTAAP